MVNQFKSWWRENQALMAFLIAQAVAVITAGGWLIAYYVKMETRVAILETRGAAYTIDRLDHMDKNITVLQQKMDQNTQSINRIVEVLTRELKK